MARKAAATATASNEITKWPEWVSSAKRGFGLKAKRTFQIKHDKHGIVRITPAMQLAFIETSTEGKIFIGFKWGAQTQAAVDPNLLEPRPSSEPKTVKAKVERSVF